MAEALARPDYPKLTEEQKCRLLEGAIAGAGPLDAAVLARFSTASATSGARRGCLADSCFPRIIC